METITLAPAALEIIDRYRNLPFPGGPVACPYYNNRRLERRGGLRTLVGKGRPAEIMEEAEILSVRERVDLTKLSPEEAKKFLVDRGLGIDCSGLAYYLLDAELRTRGKGPLKKYLRWENASLLRRLLARLRPVENTSVKTLGDDRNSRAVPLANIAPADYIVMLATGLNRDFDHVAMVHRVDRENGELKKIHYTHALAWRADGRYGHGVREGTIEITNPTGPLLAQRWTELGKTGPANETLERATLASRLEIRRLRTLATA